MSYLLGLDIGTSGVKALLISVDGKIISTEDSSYQLNTPEAGWAEQNPDDWWKATRDVIKKILLKSGIKAKLIVGISLSGQMHSSVFLDKNGEIIRPAILWNDTRTTKQCREILAKNGGLKKLTKLVSNPALEGFTAPKILWLRQNEPQNYYRLHTVLLPKDYIRFKLTGEIFTEVSDAAGTLLYDVINGSWSSEIINNLNLNPKLFPPVLKSIDIAGQISRRAAENTGLKEGIAVVAGGADNACGAAGSGIVHQGRVLISIGSSGVVLAQTDSPLPDTEGRIHLFNHVQPESWYMMGVMLSAGMAFSWLKEKMYGDRLDYVTLNKLAASIEAGSEALFFLPYLYGERTPYADAEARGVFFGISGKHNEGHFIRSVMEGVTYGLRDSLELIKEKGIDIKEVRAIGGGVKSEIWQQILADITGEEINLLNIEQGPAFGAALIAGVGNGIYKDFAEVEENFIKIKKKIHPISSNVKKYNDYYQVYNNLYTDLKKRYKQLANL